jgi:hypothetical protein
MIGAGPDEFMAHRVSRELMHGRPQDAADTASKTTPSASSGVMPPGLGGETLF